MNRFSDFFRNETPLRPLPLLHTCDAFAFRNIANQSRLVTTPCGVYKNEKLIYFFYGRPSYRTTRDHEAVSNPAFMPIVIMLEKDSVKTPKRIAPFDTGAFSAKLFDKFMHPEMRCDDFLLDPEMDMPSKLISKFFGTNKKYYHSDPVNIDIPPIQFEVFSYYSMISDRSKAPYDDRKGSIEIQTDKNIELNADNVELVILPLVFMDDSTFRHTILNEWQADYLTYSIHPGDPNEYIRLLYEKVEKHLTSGGYI